MKIAITGGIAEGKSTVLKLIEAKGFEVESADAIVIDIVADPAVQEALCRIAGLRAPLDSRELRASMNADDDVRRAVNQYLHPLVSDAIQQSTAQFFEVPLLIEACLESHFDLIWVVECSPQDKRNRLESRYGKGYESDFEAHQLSSAARRAFSDAIVSTSAPLAEVSLTLDKLVQSYAN